MNHQQHPTTILGALIVSATFAFPGRVKTCTPSLQTIGVLEVGNVFKETSVGPLMTTVICCDLFIVNSRSVMVCIRICFIITRPGETEWSLDYRIVLGQWPIGCLVESFISIAFHA